MTNKWLEMRLMVPDQAVDLVSQALMDITLKSMVPIANGILATNNLEQAEERASPTCLNKGKEITNCQCCDILFRIRFYSILKF